MNTRPEDPNFEGNSSLIYFGDIPFQKTPDGNIRPFDLTEFDFLASPGPNVDAQKDSSKGKRTSKRALRIPRPSVAQDKACALKKAKIDEDTSVATMTAPYVSPIPSRRLPEGTFTAEYGIHGQEWWIPQEPAFPTNQPDARQETGVEGDNENTLVLEASDPPSPPKSLLSESTQFYSMSSLDSVPGDITDIQANDAMSDAIVLDSEIVPTGSLTTYQDVLENMDMLSEEILVLRSMVSEIGGFQRTHQIVVEIFELRFAVMALRDHLENLAQVPQAAEDSDVQGPSSISPDMSMDVNTNVWE